MMINYIGVINFDFSNWWAGSLTVIFYFGLPLGIFTGAFLLRKLEHRHDRIIVGIFLAIFAIIALSIMYVHSSLD